MYHKLKNLVRLNKQTLHANDATGFTQFVHSTDVYTVSTTGE